MSNDKKRLGLEEAIGALRQELVASIYASRGERLQFEVGEVKVELYIEVECNLEAKGGIKFWVVELGGGSGEKNKSIHKVTIPLKPVRRDGKPVLTGSDEVPE